MAPKVGTKMKIVSWEPRLQLAAEVFAENMLCFMLSICLRQFRFQSKNIFSPGLKSNCTNLVSSFEIDIDQMNNA